MKKLGFVTPWFGLHIPGGAEMELRELAFHLAEAGQELEILTTCVKDFNSDWNINYHKQGEYKEGGLTVRRFPVDKRNTILFSTVNRKLMHGIKVTAEEEELYVREMINSSSLYHYMAEHDAEYSLFIFIPYMFGTSYYGAQINYKKAVLIPCFHDESYFYMDVFRNNYSKVAGIIYNSAPEQKLAETYYDLRNVEQIVMGIGMNTDISGNGERFRRKFGIDKPFILYAGRKDSGKNVSTLIRYFKKYIKRTESEWHLVLIGGGDLELSENPENRIHDLGFIETQDKYDAYTAASILCQPSKHESFSYVIMESWLCGRPVLVNATCNVTQNFVKEANGGLYFCNYREFEKCVDYIRQHPQIAEILGSQGKDYVKRHFSWEVITKKYLCYLDKIANKTNQ